MSNESGFFSKLSDGIKSHGLLSDQSRDLTEKELGFVSPWWKDLHSRSEDSLDKNADEAAQEGKSSFWDPKGLMSKSFDPSGVHETESEGPGVSVMGKGAFAAMKEGLEMPEVESESGELEGAQAGATAGAEAQSLIAEESMATGHEGNQEAQGDQGLEMGG